MENYKTNSGTQFRGELHVMKLGALALIISSSPPAQCFFSALGIRASIPASIKN
jgi:hypothetical protein